MGNSSRITTHSSACPGRSAQDSVDPRVPIRTSFSPIARPIGPCLMPTNRTWPAGRMSFRVT